MRRILRIAGVFWGLAAILTAHPSYAQEYQAQGADWNALQHLLAIADEAGVRLDTSAEIDISSLESNDSLLILHPTLELPQASLSAFMRAGGRVALADDFGAGDAFFESYGIRREAPRLADDVPLLRGNPALPLAHARARHPLMQGVSALITNHPSVLVHADLDPIAAFDGSNQALVLAGAVEQGRLVVIGDPSIFINNMLRFQDNRRFAENLFRYLDAERGGRVFLVTPDVRLIGRFGDGASNPLERLDDWLADFASAQTPPVALMLTAIVLVAILMVFAVSTLPTRSPYSSDALRLSGSTGGGFVGRVAFFTRRKRHLVHPLMVYKFELEGELVRHLGLQQRPLLRDVVAASDTVGLPPAELRALRELLLELDEIRRRIDHPPGPPKVSPRQLRRMVNTGERILAALDQSTREPER